MIKSDDILMAYFENELRDFAASWNLILDEIEVNPIELLDRVSIDQEYPEIWVTFKDNESKIWSMNLREFSWDGLDWFRGNIRNFRVHTLKVGATDA